MLDSFIQLLTPLNINENYYEIIVALSSFSFVVSVVNFILKKTKVFDPDKVFDVFNKLFIKNPIKRFSLTATLVVLDLIVLVLNVCNLVFTIPSDLYHLWLILTMLSFISTAASAGAKFVIASFWFGYSLPMFIRFKFSKAFSFVFFAAWMAFSTIVSVCDGMLSFNEVLTIIETFGM